MEEIIEITITEYQGIARVGKIRLIEPWWHK
jgi:hypothetical protein